MDNSNSKKYTFYNKNYNFISSVVIKINHLLNTDIQIFGSYERITSSWELIQFSTKAFENDMRIEFERPLNYFQFTYPNDDGDKVDVAGGKFLEYFEI
jgi:hypothetical protein